MNRSKISRSIVVVIFVVMIVFLSYLNLKLLVGTNSSSITSNFLKLGYIAVLITLVVIYMYIKDKLYKLKVKKEIAMIYRYVYISLVIIVTSIFSISSISSNFSKYQITFYLLISLITSFVIKRIIFNVSKSDMLSIFGMFTYSMLLVTTNNISTYFTSSIILLFMLLTILLIQILVDELKQRGIRTKKYLIESIFLGISMGISIVFGINILIWLVFAIVILFITINLDNTHISFPKKIMSSITQQKRETLYKVERINISKLLIAIIISLSIAFIVGEIGSKVIIKVSKKYESNEILNDFASNINENKISTAKISLNKVKNTANAFLNTSKTYYFVILGYILFMEILALVLKRRYDTKSTIMKVLFIALIIFTSIYNLDIYFYQPIFTMMLVLIAIVNTSNIYLNREERIKMLVA